MAKTNKWLLNRAGLLNFWYYDKEIFHFANGKLLLRGNNGAGKSVTMQSFLPVLLDGRKSPDRLDPFGSRARRMEDYLLGEKDIVDRDERTGYLFIEYKRADTEQYLTTGIGLQAKRHKNMNFWGFAILDNRRIGHDFYLYKTERHGGEDQKVPLSRIELENRIADGGVVVRTQGEYMDLVNKHVFGFQSKESFEDMIKLLIQLRSPKLSKDFKPTVIYEILEAALPPLSDDDLRSLSDTIEHMDQTKQQLEQLEREDKALKRLTDAYHNYNRYMLAEKAVEVVKAKDKWRETEQLFEKQNETKVKLIQDIEELSARIQELEQEKEVAVKEEKRLSSHKVWNLESERKELEDRLEGLKQDIEKKENQLDEQKRRELKYRNDKEQREDELDKAERVIAETLEELAVEAEETGFPKHKINVEDFTRNRKEQSFDMAVWKQEADHHYQTLSTVNEQLKVYENLKARYQELSNDYAEVVKEIDQLRHDEQEWRKTFEEDQNDQENKLHDWMKTYAFLPISDEAMQKALRALHGLYELYSYQDVRQPFIESCQSYREGLHEKIAAKKSGGKRLEKEIREADARLQEWRNMKDPEPDIHPATQDSRVTMKNSGNFFLPFYAAVEFQDHVTEEQKERIESALQQMGLLNALITEDGLNVEYDKVIQAEPNLMAHTLADYLKPDLDKEVPPISVDKVDAVLRSILIDDETGSGTVSIDENGKYVSGLLKGHAPPEKYAQFIGRTARERYRQEKISELEAGIVGLQAEKADVQAAIERFEADVDKVKEAQDRFPDDRDLQASFDEIHKNQLAIHQKTKDREQMDGRLKAIDREYKTLKRMIEKETADIDFPLTSEAFHRALTAMRHYEKLLGELENQELIRSNLVQRVAELVELIEHQETEVDELKGECNKLNDRKKRTEMHVESVERQLDQMGADDIRRQIQGVQKRLKQIESGLKANGEELPRAKVALENTNQELTALVQDVKFWGRLTQSWMDTFKKETGHAFVKTESFEDPWESAKVVKRDFASFYENHERAKVTEHLTKAFYAEQPNLMEYRLSEYEGQVKSPEWMEDENWKDDQLVMIGQWKQLTSRNYIEMDYDGQRVSPYFVNQSVEAEMERNREYLKEQDRELYEEIILKSVGNMLRSRIQRAERWVKDMNDLMRRRDPSSALTFSIRWKPRTAEAEEELDTQDLVELLRMNARLLKESDLDRVTRHFRSRIDRAKELADDSGVGNTLHQVLKDVLDYRKWFSFILHYKRGDEPGRELTNNAFYKFSGGEKAMAMYIPLFTAAYSRYKEADDAAPYIISLDEAFAGVDENNIRDMFEVVEELDFNYIMNSQALWGDYDTVSELAIAEIVRPKNADYVTVIPYHWDGHVRRYAPRTEIDETENEIASTQEEDE